MKIHSDLNLKPYNTLAFSAKARYLVEIATLDALRQLCDDATFKQLPWVVLGAGSNVVFCQDFPGLVVLNRIKYRTIIDHDRLVEVGAGENWHDFVYWTLQQGLFGLENLALIPGTVGAAPVQNIGAYGLEMAQYFDSLQAVERVSGQLFEFDKAACAFGYRDSCFKQAFKDRFMITAVRFRLPKQWQPRIDYADLQTFFQQNQMTNVTAFDVFNAVVAVRQRKLPDPAIQPNAGSFFKNPVVDQAHFQQLQRDYPDVIGYGQAHGDVKLAAGWLIEQCGWKGRQWKTAVVHDRQALVLINQKGNKSDDLLELAQLIQKDVYTRFTVDLEVEPTFY